MLLVLAASLWAGSGLISRAAPIDGPGLAFWRCLAGAAIYQAVLAVRGLWPRWASVRASAAAGVAFGTSIVCLFIAYKTTTLVTAAVIGSLQPLLLGLVTHRSGQRLDAGAWMASGAAAVGTVVVVLGSSRSSSAWSLSGDLFAVAAIAANMVYVIATKRVRDVRGSLDYQASLLWVATLVLAPVAVLTAGARFTPEPVAWWSILGLVAVGGSGHLLFSSAQRHVSLAASSAILITEVVVIAVGAAVLFDQPLGPLQVIGMMISGGAVAAWLRRSGT
jgi:drug/metabolite transporter (DMT)-like permease